MSWRKRKPGPAGNAGCNYMLMTGLLVCSLLLINGLLVKAFMSANLSGVDLRISQAAQFVVPVAMIFVEFWVFDLMTTRGARQSREE